MTEQLGFDSIKVNRPRCPYCHDDIRADDEKAGCNQCMAWFHEECWQEHGGCTSCATPARALPPRAVPRGQLTTAPQTPSIHNRLGYTLLTPQHKEDAAKQGRALALKVTAFALLFTMLPALGIASSDLPIYECSVIVLNGAFFLFALYLAVSGYKKQKVLKQSLGEILEERSQPQQSENVLGKE